MKKDKFEIFQRLIFAEQEWNHYGTYISCGQLANLMINVNNIYDNWDDNKSLDENVFGITYSSGNRSISPLGIAGKNRL